MKIPAILLLFILPLLAPAPASAGTIYWEMENVNTLLTAAQTDSNDIKVRPNGDYVLHLALWKELDDCVLTATSFAEPAGTGFETTAEWQAAMDSFVLHTVVFNVNNMPYDEPYSVTVHSDKLIDGEEYELAVFSTYSGFLVEAGYGNYIDYDWETVYSVTGGGTLSTDVGDLSTHMYGRVADDVTPITVPEPASAGLALAGVALLFKRRRK